MNQYRLIRMYKISVVKLAKCITVTSISGTY